jgi:hypothetical protein
VEFSFVLRTEALHDQTAPDLQQSRPLLVDAGLVEFGYLEGESFCSSSRAGRRAAGMLLSTTRISFAKSESYRTEEMPVKSEPGKVHTGDRHYGKLHPGDLA